MKITVVGYGPGTARITVKTNDGSKKSITYTVVVK
jgi:uncharacterized protein YjdB